MDKSWEFTSNIKDADVIPCHPAYLLPNMYPGTIVNPEELLNSISNNQILLMWNVETNGEHMIPSSYRFDKTYLYEHHKKIILVHTNALDIDHPQYIHCDMMFNRQKVYNTDYDEAICLYQLWTNDAPKITYQLDKIDKPLSDGNKKFLVLNRTLNKKPSYPGLTRDHLKIKLSEFMKSLNAPMYISDPANGHFLKSEGWEDNPNVSHLDTRPSGTWYPASNYYYNTSYVSVCIETLYTGPDIFYPCEKYFDPLIKGNFPLIFSCQHAIKNLKEFYGFKFPDWIDYSYDDIYNVEDRLSAYFNSIVQLSNKSLNEIHSLYLKDKDILEHNRSIFYTRPYDLLHSKVERSIKELNWK